MALLLNSKIISYNAGYVMAIVSMFKTKKEIIQTGLDIGTSSIKLIQLAGTPENLLLTKFSVLKTEENGTSRKKALEKIAGDLSTKEVNISISGPAVLVRYIELPTMTEEELKSSMQFQAEEYIPLKIDQVIVDCQVLEKIGHGKMRVLLAAAKRDAISERLNMVKEAGLTVNIFDCDSFALVNTFLLNFPDINSNSNVALLNLGERLATINILKGKIPHFTRELEIGGQDFVKAISERLKLDIKSVSELKEYPKEKLKELEEVTKPIIVHIIEEIKRSLNYYENQAGRSVNIIYLSGGLSEFMDFESIFRESMGIDCKLWDPLKNLKIANGVSSEGLNKVKSQLHIALGLAIRR